MLTAAVIRWVAMSALAALWGVEHVRLALRRSGDRPRRIGLVLLGLAVPGVGAVRAWRSGAKLSAALYVTLISAYVMLVVKM